MRTESIHTYDNIADKNDRQNKGAATAEQEKAEAEAEVGKKIIIVTFELYEINLLFN